MRLSLRPQAVIRLLAVAIALTVCYFVLYFQVSTWKDHHLSTLWSAPFSPAPTGIPEKLWYKLGPNGLSDQLREYTNSCIQKNPTFQPKFITDVSGDDFVEQHFANRPDIVRNFLAISIPIIKADLLRYLILYEYGGIWNDLDVSCEAPINEWIPAKYKANASVVVGMEFDKDGFIRQFASWTIMARPKSPHMLQVVEDCLEGLIQKANELKVGMQDLKVDMIDDIVDVSGPRRLTRGILRSLDRTLEKSIADNAIFNISEPRLIGDVLVLPITAFAESMNEKYGTLTTGRKLVIHHYAGSWKNAKGGEDFVII